MTDPTGGAPNPQAPLPPTPAGPPPGAAPVPPPSGGNWNSPPPGASGGGFNTSFQQAAVEPGPAPGVAYSDLVTRVIAYIIDSILLAIVGGFVGAVIGVAILGFLLTGGFGLALVGAVVLAVIMLALSAAYFIYTWTTMRASPGQKILNLQTVNAVDGATLTRNQAMRRWAFLFGPQAIASALQFGLTGSDVSGIAPLVSLASFLYTLYLLYTASQSPKRQGFHDVQAGTVVVKRIA